jgi:hypothetical protein
VWCVTVGFNPNHNNGGFTPGPYAPLPKLGGRQGGSLSGDDCFQISLTYEGQSVLQVHHVWGIMGIRQLIDEAEAIFGLNPPSILLVLVSLGAATLHRDSAISGPPAVRPGSNVMVLCICPTHPKLRRLGNGCDFGAPPMSTA